MNETLPCSKCGKQVTTEPKGRAQHTRDCKGQVEEVGPSEVIEIDALDTANNPTPMVSIAANPTLADEIKYAEAKTGQQVTVLERVRKEAPDAIVSFTGAADEFRAVEKRLRAEKKVPEDHVFYWGDIREHKANVHKYIPVNDDGKQPQIGENEAFHRHKSLYEAETAASEAQSRAMFDTEYDTGGIGRGKKLNEKAKKVIT